MTRTNRLMLAAMLACCAQLVAVAITLACTPPPNFVPASIEQRSREADIVIVGEVVTTTQPALPAADYAAWIRVDEAIKARVGGVIKVKDYGPSGLCYSEVSEGEFAIFVDRGADGVLKAHYTVSIDAVARATAENIARAKAALEPDFEVWLPIAWR